MELKKWTIDAVRDVFMHDYDEIWFYWYRPLESVYGFYSIIEKGGA